MIKAWFINHRFALRWIGISFLIKSILFILFAILFYQNWPRELITNYIFIESGDTSGYYAPIESFVCWGDYNSYCRMPGLLPIYGSLYYFFGAQWGKTIIIILQFITSTISVYLLAQTAVYIFKNKRFFYLSFFLYAISTFVSNWDHYGLSDSFGTSFLIFSVYFIVKFKNTNQLKQLVLSGIFMAWSVFFRPVHGILVPVFALIYLTNFRHLQSTFKYWLWFGLPLLITLSVWTLSNYRKYQKPVILQGPNSECFGALTPELLAIRGLIIGWGGDYQPWSKGSEAEWFFGKNETPDKKSIPENYFTSRYNYDSLIGLRRDYHEISGTMDGDAKKILSMKIIQRSGDYLMAYKKEHAFNYYIINRIKILKQLLFPRRLDDFPTPAYQQMNLFHKLLKSFYFLLFLFISITGFAGCLWLLGTKNYFAIIPMTMLFLIGCVLCYVEQRYLCPAYPYLVIGSAALLIRAKDRLLKKG